MYRGIQRTSNTLHFVSYSFQDDDKMCTVHTSANLYVHIKQSAVVFYTYPLPMQTGESHECSSEVLRSYSLYSCKLVL